MSLHIELTDEAKAEFERQQRKSLISSIVVSALSFILLGILFFAVKIIIVDKMEASFVTYSPPGSPDSNPESDDLNPQQESASTAAPTRILTSTAMADVTVPTIDIPTDASPNISTNVEINIGSGGSAGAGMGGLPQTVAKRCSVEDRLQRIKRSGGSEQYEDAVVKGLRFLMKKQHADGSWGTNNKSAMTGLVLLAYLAHCETPYSEEFGESCQNAITFLINVSKKNNGSLSETPTNKFFPYQHAIATYALAEAYMFCNSIGLPIDGLGEAVEKGGALISRSQAQDGSWMYWYRQSEGNGSYPDLSITGWNVQAIKALKHTDVKNDAERVLRRAEAFVKRMCDTKTGLFSYKPGTPRPSMVPVGVLSLQMMEVGHAREAREGIKFMERAIKPEFNDAYTYYYAAQALINRGGPAWDNFGKKMGDVIVEKQKDDGSWPNGSHNLSVYNTSSDEPEIYRTCLNILTLEVYYRFLPATGEGTRNVSTAGRD